MQDRRIDIPGSQYQVLIGTGGVGSGIFFSLEGNATLGREESRAGSLLARKDYCKLHIITHYVKALLGPGFPVIPAGKVGNGAVGQQLLNEMMEIGLDTRYMQIEANLPTLFSVCFVYPDGSGGNLTASNSASASLSEEEIERLEPEFARWKGHGIALAAPEVPIPARFRLLELASRYDFFRAVCLTSEEARSAEAVGLVEKADLLAVNLDEAAALARFERMDPAPEEIIEAVLERIHGIQPNLVLSVTAGKNGSWIWDGNRLARIPAFAVKTVSTAGAGDAYLAGLLSGLAAGLALEQAGQLGCLAAARSVTSPDTIDAGLNRETLLALALANHFELDPQVNAFLMRP